MDGNGNEPERRDFYDGTTRGRVSDTRPVTDPMEGLQPVHMRVAMLRAADMDIESIAQWLNCEQRAVQKMLDNPKVQRLVFKLAAITTKDLAPQIRQVNVAIANTTMEAFEAEREVLRFSRRQMNDDGSIKAAALCANTAQDILDRAGAAAPKHSVHEVREGDTPLDEASAMRIADVLGEMEQVNAIEIKSDARSLDQKPGDKSPLDYLPPVETKP